jgi:hypothetical protein
VEVANAFYAGDAFLRRFIMDPMNYNKSFGNSISAVDLLKFRAEILIRHLKLNVYRS